MSVSNKLRTVTVGHISAVVNLHLAAVGYREFSNSSKLSFWTEKMMTQRATVPLTTMSTKAAAFTIDELLRPDARKRTDNNSAQDDLLQQKFITQRRRAIECSRPRDFTGGHWVLSTVCWTSLNYVVNGRFKPHLIIFWGQGTLILHAKFLPAAIHRVRRITNRVLQLIVVFHIAASP